MNKPTLDFGNPFEVLFRRLESIEDSLKVIQQSIPTKAPPADLPDEGGMELAMQVTGFKRQTLYGMVSRREIPHIKRGNRLRFSRRKLQAWLEEGARPTAVELAAAPIRRTRKNSKTLAQS